ncbi:transporter [candidate division LCP-89 bacterium B3_LCP]|uniref:Transporter n=1 Tax=candidate division LCP-89 bacterium B3_LCP TaxID=2012998 RepID=A0A532UZB0_UNCL8|nr:MAG: transporter [candidate division LCP-89 bacterium B3_LCP]
MYRLYKLRFLQDLTLGRYFPGDSALHRLDSRTKIVCSLMLMLTVFFIGNVVAIVLFLFLSILLFPAAKIPLHLFWRYVTAFKWLYLITFLIHLFFHSGHEILRIPLIGLAVTTEGITAGILFTVRIAVLVLVSTILMAVATPQELTDGLEKIFRPLKFFGLPVSEGALVVSIALRFVPILMQEAKEISKAQAARGVELEGSRIAVIRNMLPMVFPLFAGALKKADDLALALEARAYRCGGKRTQMLTRNPALHDFTAISVVTITAVLFILYG